MNPTTNNGRPLPWHDTPTCERDMKGEKCGGPMVPAGQMPNSYDGPRGTRIACAACGHGRVGKMEEVARAMWAAKAWEMYEDGLIHTDRGCARCNGPLPLERTRLCAGCVEKDNAERQASLFP
jgi:hypothetical protein